ncbi:hypothetical protein EVJ50_05445 [Synechococcus sp. RSCCF101]|uniref:DUF6464 family protein n=1 Tax=Synechococcus sp. RSCCF101 TaxID=2511069 RepID=UPI001244DE32|nr:DUF6464 family protein [Synechococcus sp. RSCCF101]QEY31774.1 hypothetical protein EVJ50_05445 [Synechococcus sp. RSCCF101]
MPTPVELRLAGSDALLDRLVLEEIPHPGRWWEHRGRPYLILQRRHRYGLRRGRYVLASIALQVRPQKQPADAQWWQGRWVIGDPACRYNARSPLLRCAVLPEGPCSSCAHHSERGAQAG